MGTGTPLYGDRAPTIGQYVVIAGSALLDNERTLTGTANQIVVTDNGAGSTVVLSTPQNIHTAATPTFGGIIVADGGTIGQAAGPLITFSDTDNLLVISGCKTKFDNDIGVGTTPITGRGVKVAQSNDYADSQLTRAIDIGVVDTTSASNTHYIQAAFVEVDSYVDTGVTHSGYIRILSAVGYHRRSGTITQLTGALYQVGSYNGGEDTTGTISALKNLEINQTKTTSSTITNSYGLYIGTLYGTNSWSIYDISDKKVYLKGQVGIGIPTSMLGKLHIDQPSTTAAIPVLFLDQGDVSEQCIKFSSDATDRDIHLFTVNVTGAPAMDWDESEDGFSLNKGLDFTAGDIDLAVGKISSHHTVFSTAGPTDNVDVSSINVLLIDCSGNDVTIGGFAGGVAGQVLYIAKLCASAHTATLEHLEGGGSQDIYLHVGADEALDTEYGGWTLVCNGTSWFDLSHAKHV
jgi:hypothetical protein